MKKNNRGFLLAESLVVSTFVLTILILLYIQFSNLTTNYKNSYNYNNVESIYSLSSIAKYLEANNNDLLSKLSEAKPYVMIYNKNEETGEIQDCNSEVTTDAFCGTFLNKIGAKTVIYTYSDISYIQKYISENEDSNIKQSFREFISKVETASVQNKGRIFAEFDNGTYATIAVDAVSEVAEPPITPPTTEIIGGQEVAVVTEGDGLYADINESSKYIYRGSNPNNYIMFNNELWRIVSKETDGTYKIIKKDFLSETQAFDTANNRSADKNTYCTSPQNGCNVFAAVSGNFSTPDNSHTGTVTEDSSIKKYLNETYYNSLSSTAKTQITPHSFNIGVVDILKNAEEDSIANNIADEKMYTWTGNVGLINVSDVLKASTNSSCTSASYQYKWLSGEDTASICDSNYLTEMNNAKPYWTINGLSGEGLSESNWNWKLNIFEKDSTKLVLSNTNSNYSQYGNILPVVYLNSSTLLTGTGTESDPFQIH